MESVKRIYEANQLFYSLITSWLCNGNDSDFEYILEGADKQTLSDIHQASKAAQIIASKNLNMADTNDLDLISSIKSTAAMWLEINNYSMSRTIEMARRLCLINTAEMERIN